jgi:hypothetical protein
VQLVILYRKLELHYNMKEAESCEVLNQSSGTGFTVQLLFLYRKLEYRCSLEKAKYLQVLNKSSGT